MFMGGSNEKKNMFFFFMGDHQLERHFSRAIHPNLSGVLISAQYGQAQGKPSTLSIRLGLGDAVEVANQLQTAMFNSYTKLPQGIHIYIYIHTFFVYITNVVKPQSSQNWAAMAAKKPLCSLELDLQVVLMSSDGLAIVF